MSTYELGESFQLGKQRHNAAVSLLLSFPRQTHNLQTPVKRAARTHLLPMLYQLNITFSSDKWHLFLTPSPRSATPVEGNGARKGSAEVEPRCPRGRRDLPSHRLHSGEDAQHLEEQVCPQEGCVA